MEMNLLVKSIKNICATLNYIKNFLILGSTITGFISISSFASLVGTPIGATRSAIGLKIFAMTAGIKKCKSIIKKKKRSMIQWNC